MDVIFILSGMYSKETDISPEQIQLIVVMEELAELSQKISKVVHRRGNELTVLEELADVTIILQYIQRTMGFTDEDVNRAVNVKLSRYSLVVPNTETR